MTTEVTDTTFLSNYNDDYRDSDHFHRILFNNGRNLQARELTQSQSIIQAEIARMGRYLFVEGGIFNTSMGAVNTGASSLGYVKLSTSLIGITGYALLQGLEIVSGDGIKAIVKAVIPAVGGDPDTILVKYIDGNNLAAADTTKVRTFGASDALSYDDGSGFSGTLNVQVTDVDGNRAIGFGSMIEIPQYDTFVAGHFIMVEAQTLVVSKYDPNASAVIGFKLVEEVVSTADNIALYDNSGTTPNLTSPGADRYRIKMVLTTEADTTADDTFYPVYNVVNGDLQGQASEDKYLAQLGTYLAGRTAAVNGDFVAGRSQSFDLVVDQDSDDGFMLYTLNPGTAFVGGRYIDRPDVRAIRVSKPRSTSVDIGVGDNQFVPAAYGNYFIADETDTFGLIEKVNNRETINLYNKSNIAASGNVIGTARVRGVDKVEDAYRIHIFDLDMDSSGGSEYLIGQTRSIGTDSASYANLAKIDGRYDLHDRDNNSLIFPLPLDRVNNVEDNSVTFAMQRVYGPLTTNGSGEVTFSTGGNTLADPEQWIVAVDSSGGLISAPSYTGSVTSSVALTGLPTSSSVRMLGYENVVATRKTKTLVTNFADQVTPDSQGFIQLSKPDIYKFVSVTDDTTSSDITYKYDLNNGQTDNFYGLGFGQLVEGATAPSGTVTVTYDYFTHNTPSTLTGYFAGAASYGDIDYDKIPSFTTNTGVTYRLSDVLDFRPTVDADGVGFAGSGGRIELLPRSTATITTGEVEYWQPRVDVISITSNGEFNVRQGSSQRKVTVPPIPPSELLLHQVNLNPYTLNVDDLSHVSADNRGYRMSDIRQLENRLANVEETSALTLAELSTQQLAVIDPTDALAADRTKLGLTGDTFEFNNQSALRENDYRAMLNKVKGVLTPLNFKRTSPLYYDSDQSSGTIRLGSTVWPSYTEEVYIVQDQASSSIDVNQYDIAATYGTGRLEPSYDTWTNRKQVDVSYTIPEGSEASGIGDFIVPSQGNQTEYDGE